MDLWQTWLLAASALHLGFQATVTLLVYPALVDAGRAGEGWAVAHASHSRRITPVVVVVYGALLPPVVVAAGRVAEGEAGGGAGLAVAGAVATVTATAVVAAPAHGVLGRGWSERVAQRLLRADRVRLIGALVGLAGALSAV